MVDIVTAVVTFAVWATIYFVVVVNHGPVRAPARKALNPDELFERSLNRPMLGKGMSEKEDFVLRTTPPVLWIREGEERAMTEWRKEWAPGVRAMFEWMSVAPSRSVVLE